MPTIEDFRSTGRGARILAVAAVIAVLGGAVTILVGLVAAPGSWLQGYVSEAGVAGLPLAGVYRAGFATLALGVACLGLSQRARLVVVILLGAALLCATAGAIPCTGGCPLPPFEVTSAGDVVHASAGILGMVMLAGAMAASWWTAGDRVLRRLSGAAAACTVPLGGAMGLTMLFAGRVPLGAALERVLLVLAVTWLIGAALVTALRVDASP